MEADAKHIFIHYDTDIVEARLAARAVAAKIGFNGSDLVLIAPPSPKSRGTSSSTRAPARLSSLPSSIRAASG